MTVNIAGSGDDFYRERGQNLMFVYTSKSEE